MVNVTEQKGATLDVPRATYRFQFHEGFPLSKARELVPYLRDLGVSHLYASPLFKARPHSTHGYDTCDFHQLNPELGSQKDLEDLVEKLRSYEMGLVLDIVPNHMGIGGPENHWWWDVLENGRQSPFAKYFDIDWDSPDPRLRGKVMVPVLGDRYNRVLARHEFRVEAGGNGCRLRCGDNLFPIRQETLHSSPAKPEELNGDPEALDALLERQNYRLAWYGRGDKELNYRRFFNITDLPGLRMEDEQVFEQVFALLRRWLKQGLVDGLRVDHPDGLRDPGQFLQRLSRIARNKWIVVEKILEPGESLPGAWPVAGTTGYDFLNQAGGIFVDPNGCKPLTELYGEFGGSPDEFSVMARQKKRLALEKLLAAEVDRLTRLLIPIAAEDWRYRDFSRAEIADVLIECIACFPVYRTYAGSDKSAVAAAIREARQARPDLPADLFEMLRILLTERPRGEAEEEFAARFQQVSSAAMAKGIEDTAFYCYNRFAALNEVGGNPGRFGITVDEFHQFCRCQQQHWPHTMLASSTHDTKRGEDVRARLYVLSEIPQAWREAVYRWSAINRRHRRHDWPDANAEYLFYQTAVGAWPLSADRAVAYMKKASCEAKEHTSWTNGNPEYDSALRDFVTAALNDPGFTADVEQFVARIARPGYVNSLAQTLLKLAAPGVPDIYQGSELWDLRLVDPDNRQPVDFAARQQMLSRAANLTAAEAWDEWQSAMPKLWLIQRVLQLRAQRPELFDRAAAYDGIKTHPRLVAFKRGKNLVAVVPRLTLGLSGGWADATLALPDGAWRNELTGETLPGGAARISELLARFPVALLTREEEQ